jgi:hypothetical protein
MELINRMYELLNIQLDNNVLDIYNKISNNRKNEIFNLILNNFNQFNKNFQNCGVDYLVYLIFTKLIKHKNIERYIKILNEEGYINFLNSGNIKLIINYLSNYTNDNVEVFETIINILNILDNTQLFIILSSKYIDSNGNSQFEYNNLINRGSELYNIQTIDGNDFYSKYFNYIQSPEKENEVEHLVSIYSTQEKLDYFSFAINKLFNSNIGVINIEYSNTSMNLNSLAFAIYYIGNCQMTLEERFKKFTNVITYEQLVYVGV